jgi:hypothetical protein
MNVKASPLVDSHGRTFHVPVRCSREGQPRLEIFAHPCCASPIGESISRRGHAEEEFAAGPIEFVHRCRTANQASSNDRQGYRGLGFYVSTGEYSRQSRSLFTLVQLSSRQDADEHRAINSEMKFDVESLSDFDVEYKVERK